MSWNWDYCLLDHVHRIAIEKQMMVDWRRMMIALLRCKMIRQGGGGGGGG
jgi:hypothetical protein